MPVVLDRSRSDGKPSRASRSPELVRPGARVIEVGLLNNMPDAALQATERQFVELLGAAASDGILVRLRFFSLPEISRTDGLRSHLSAFYSDLDGLLQGRLDGLIVTGSEPRAPTLSEEPYWAALTHIVDWAEENTTSTVWSCLAAHAAVLHLDGVGRRRLPAKRSGVFEFGQVARSPLLAGLPDRIRVPHSRWNDLGEDDLRSHGYRILTRSPEAGVDVFTKQWRSLFVYLQGHPEYDPDSLQREYRRDVGRFLRGETGVYPDPPANAFDEVAEEAVRAFGAQARQDPDPRRLALFPALTTASGPQSTWRQAAVELCRNWLSYLASTP